MVKSNTSKDVSRDDPPSADEDVARLRLQLRHFSLSELEEKGLVRWNRDKHIVMRGPKFDERRAEEEID